MGSMLHVSFKTFDRYALDLVIDRIKHTNQPKSNIRRVTKTKGQALGFAFHSHTAGNTTLKYNSVLSFIHM